MVSKCQKLFLAILIVVMLLIVCAPTTAESTRVIFHAPRRRLVMTSQILSSPPKEKPCQKCHIRDHRGRCRRLLSFNADGIKC